MKYSRTVGLNRKKNNKINLASNYYILIEILNYIYFIYEIIRIEYFSRKIVSEGLA